MLFCANHKIRIPVLDIVLPRVNIYGNDIKSEEDDLIIKKSEELLLCRKKDGLLKMCS